MTDTAVTTRDARPPLVVLRERLQSRSTELKAALGNDVPVENFIRAVVTSATLNPEILTCSWNSVWLACMRACRDGLIPDGQDAALVPYGKGEGRQAQYIPMTYGLVRRFRRSGQFKWVTAGIVREGEPFEHWIDESGEHFKHVPGDAFGIAKMTKCYALATTKDGGIFIAVLSLAEANKIRAQARATREDSPWQKWPEEMYKKTALRRLCKYLPQARDLMPEGELEGPLPELGAVADTGAKSPEPQHVEFNPSSVEQVREDQPDGDGASVAQGSDSRDADAPSIADEADEGIDPLAEAYRKGREHKAAGHPKRGMPREFNEAGRTREALAWQAGFDGQDMPTFGPREGGNT